jgi:beta-mannosidase
MLKTVSLNGAWEFRELGAQQSPWKKGTVPGCVQLDLLNLGEVPDPFYRLNEIEMHRLEEKEWVYHKDFQMTEEDVESDEIDLVFEGIDTIADLYLNGTYLGRAEDMFMPYRYDVSDIVDIGDNNIEVRFHSPLTTIKEMERTSPVTLISNCETARPYIRKAQYSYGWDWGPRIAQVGLWRPVHLEVSNQARVVEPYFYTEALDGATARVRVRAAVEQYDPEELQAEISVYWNDHLQARTTTPVVETRGEPAIDVSMVIPDARLWWPNEIGEQPLYDIVIRLSAGGVISDEHTFRSGIRTVRLLQEDDVEGRSFIFVINGTKVFAKGANWIPADSLLPRLTRDDYYSYIRLAQQAHMNMLRIWGGGIYEDPAFFRACDELGIMVWQDFTYACAQYPDELDWFQELARDEAEEVVKALRNHPSLVLWCGNNENNWGFDEWWHNGVPKYLGNYVYREILPQVIADLDPSRPYWVSSPYGQGKPNSMSDGDRHSWTVWSNWQDYGGYLKDTGRFLSEFGFQAMPNWKTVLSYTAADDRTILSPVVIDHNKMTEGTERLLRFLAGRVGLPKDLQSFVYLTQFNQAEAIKTGVEFWRRRKFMTSGALYWQINDCWPVASWSCLDYYKRKKGLYYYTKRFFAPVLPTLRLDGNEILVEAVSDHLRDLNAHVRITAYKLDGQKLGERVFDARLLANGVTPLGRLSLADLEVGYSPRVLPVDASSTTLPRERNGELLDTVVFVDLQAASPDGSGCHASNYLVFERFRALNLQEPKIDVQAHEHSITLCAPVPAFGVFVETEHDVDLSDNCLILEPDTPCTITFSAEPGKVTIYDLTTLVVRV